jgi:hypothetical protein
MYWNNPIQTVYYPNNDNDIIFKSLHDGAHCLYYDPTVPRQQIQYQQTLQDICDWANQSIQQSGIDKFVCDPISHYDIANMVKLNMWIDDIQKQGIVKPMMLFYDGQDQFGINNGESRLRALECIPKISTIQAFISTSTQYQNKFDHLISVTCFDQFAELCRAVPGQEFLFTLTDPKAPYGIFWYEYNSSLTAPVTPGDSWCVEVFRNYMLQHNQVNFTPEWFDTLIPWANYKSNN